MRGDAGRPATFRDRLQPSLIDRLMDDQPQERTESAERRSIPVDRLRACVLRDLEALFNNAPLSQVEIMVNHPRVSASVLNYGFPSLLGVSPRQSELDGLCRKLRQSIVNFEPRIDARTLQVEALSGASADAPGALVFQITGLLWGKPLPTQIQLQTIVDLTTGDARVSETRDGERQGGTT